MSGDAKLAEIVVTAGAGCSQSRPLNPSEGEAGEEGKNRYHDKNFDQRSCRPGDSHLRLHLMACGHLLTRFLHPAGTDWRGVCPTRQARRFDPGDTSSNTVAGITPHRGPLNPLGLRREFATPSACPALAHRPRAARHAVGIRVLSVHSGTIVGSGYNPALRIAPSRLGGHGHDHARTCRHGR